MSQLFNQNTNYDDFLETNNFDRGISSPNKKLFGFEDDMIDSFKPQFENTKGNLFGQPQISQWGPFASEKKLFSNLNLSLTVLDDQMEDFPITKKLKVDHVNN